MHFEPIFEDRWIIAFDKPSGLATQGGSGVRKSLEDVAAAYAKSARARPKLVHRLDRETSGIIVLARTKSAAAFLSEAFAQRRVAKTYWAIVCGALLGETARIEAPLVKETRGGVDRMRVARPNEAHAQPALTRLRTLAANQIGSLVEAAPETGRMHQIRVHLASIGHPIAADAKYGGLFSLGGIPASRLMLHAAALSFPHPAGETMTLSAPPPRDFTAFLSAIGLEAGLAPRPSLDHCPRS